MVQARPVRHTLPHRHPAWKRRCGGRQQRGTRRLLLCTCRHKRPPGTEAASSANRRLEPRPVACRPAGLNSERATTGVGRQGLAPCRETTRRPSPESASETAGPSPHVGGRRVVASTRLLKSAVATRPHTPQPVSAPPIGPESPPVAARSAGEPGPDTVRPLPACRLPEVRAWSHPDRPRHIRGSRAASSRRA